MPQSSHHHRILVVDDDQQVRHLFRIILERAGYEVETAGDGSEAVSRYGDHPCDLVVTDIVMPEKEGIETIIELRDKNPALPIIAVSGGGRIGAQDYLMWARRFGVDRTFSKPVPAKRLVDAVGELLAGVRV